MKKGIFIFLIVFALASTCQLYGYQYKNGSVFVFTDMLVWRVREGSADNWAQVITPSGTTQSATLVDAPFDWNAGFRLGIGYNGSHSWITTLYYTNFYTNASSHATGRVFSSFLGNFFANNTNGTRFGPFYRDASMQWKIFFNTIDLELAHAFTINQDLLIKPFIGLKTAFINQDIHSSWQGPSTTNNAGNDIPITTFSSATEDLKQDFFGIGPSAGLNITWPIYKVSKGTFNIFGNLSGALLWGHWCFKDLYQNNTPVSIAINLSNINGAAPTGRGLIGLEWIGYLSKVNINIRISYEAQVWFNQMQFYALSVGRLNHLMALQGGVLEFALTF